MENFVGKRLDGRYEIMEIIGVGGMAVVYKAFDNIDHKMVALKILKNEYLTNTDFKRRFKNESKAISVLSHQNIVKVFDVSYGDRIQYIVMEYVDGISLKEYMQQQGVIDPREALYFVTQILRALQHAHDKGIVHRDIKPQNIMLQADGTIKVADFGIARFSRSETRTMTDGAIGSVHYISPEQAKGSITDAKTDLYAVGVILYEMLTGRLPFQSDNAVSVALMQLQNDPESPRSINPDIPVGLEQIILRAMQKNQSDRYQSASEILLDIDSFKKNPNIKFDYIFDNSNDNELPTKTAPDYSSGSSKNEIDDDEYIDDIENEGSERGKKATIAVLTGVLIALIVFAGVLISIFAPSNGKVAVPDFYNMDYLQVMHDNDQFEFDIKFIPNEEFDEEKIFDQDPEAGKSVKKGSVVTLFVASSDQSGGIELPDVTNEDYTVAESRLKSLGFIVNVYKEYNEDVELRHVIRTEPEAGTMAPAGSTVSLFVATNQKIEPVVVPNLVGKTVNEAREILEGLNLRVEVEEHDNRAPYGTVLGCSEVGETVNPGTIITLFVSNGRDPQKTTEKETTTKETTEKETTTEETTEGSTTKPSTTKETTTKPSTTKETTTKQTTTAPSTTKRQTTLPAETTTARQEVVTTAEPTNKVTEAEKPEPDTQPQPDPGDDVPDEAGADE